MPERKYRMPKLKTRRPLAARRKFDSGKSYKLADIDNRRDNITSLADSLRKHGWDVRVIQVKDTYALYRRKSRQNISPRSGGSKGTIHVRSHARKRTKGVRAHTRKR